MIAAPARRFGLWAGLAVAGMLAMVGLAWSDCLMIAAATFMGHRLFIATMTAGAPWDGWRAAVRCIEAGLAGLLTSLGLAGLALAALAGWWTPEHAHADLLSATLIASAIALTALHADTEERVREAWAWAGAAAALGFALWVLQAGFRDAPCLLIMAWAIVLACSSWRLTTTTASDLFRSGQRFP